MALYWLIHLSDRENLLMETTLKSIVVGELFVGGPSTVISTALGTCVSVCLYSEVANVGGMVHFALPDQGFAEGSHRGDLHFGDLAIKELVDRLFKKYG